MTFRDMTNTVPIYKTVFHSLYPQNKSANAGYYFLLCLFLFIIPFSGGIFAQAGKFLIHGDTLKPKTINGVECKEVIGGVIITQGNLVITCLHAIHYEDKNEAELIGNVVARQDTITIKAQRGYYYGNTRTAFSETGIELNNGHFTLKARKGYYYANEKKADFYENVKMFDSVSNVTTNHLTYLRDEDKATAVGNVVMSDTSSVLFADSLIHFRAKRLSYGYKNVKIFNPKSKTIILAGMFEKVDSTGYSRITDKPLFVQVDSTAGGKTDTLYISSKTMDAYQDSTDRFVARDSVKMFRSTFSAVNNLTTLFRKENKIFTYKLEGDLKPPVIWNDDSQLYGDSIYINMEKKKLKLIEIFQNAFMLSLNEGQQFRFDQMSGRKIYMHFNEGEINNIDIDGALLSIYFLYDNKEPNGLVKSSSEKGKMLFKEKKLDDVKLYGSVVSDYHPENVILGKEKDFTLPGFVLFKNRPRKEDFLTGEVKSALNRLQEIIKNENGKYPYLKK